MRSGTLRQKILALVGMPQAEALGMPRVTLDGNKSLLIEQQQGIVHFADECLRVRTRAGVLEVSGKNLQIKVMSREGLLVNGEIISAVFCEVGHAK